MKFFETCILAFMLITQSILADEQGAPEAGETLDQFDNNDRTEELLAQKITKRARIPKFVGKRDFYTTDDLSNYELTDDSHNIPIELEQPLHPNLLTSLLSGSSEDPQVTDDEAQSDLFDRQTRYRPLMVGRRSKWVPKFVGKRRGPLFVGRRRSPYFVGKRTSYTDEDMAEEKRRHPIFIGKRADPVLVARGLSKPLFVGRRARPIFIGRRRPSGDLDSSIFMGRRSVKDQSEALSNHRNVLIEKETKYNTSGRIYVNQKNVNERIPPNVKRKQLKKLHYYNRRKRASDILYKKERRNFDVPYFVGKRNSIRTNKRFLSNRNSQFEPPDFIGKRSQNYVSNKIPISSHQFIERKSPRLINPNFDEIKRKRFTSPDFIGKRFTWPYFKGGKRDFVSPDFIGKRTPSIPSVPIGNRGQYFSPSGVWGKANAIYANPESIIDVFFGVGSSDFIANKARVLNSENRIPKPINSGESYTEQETLTKSLLDKNWDISDLQPKKGNTNFDKISSNKGIQHFHLAAQPKFEEKGYPEVIEFLPGLDQQTPDVSSLQDGDITKRSNGKRIRFEPPEFIGKRNAIPKHALLMSDEVANTLLERLGFHYQDKIKINRREKAIQSRPYITNNAQIGSSLAFGQPIPDARNPNLMHVRKSSAFSLPSFLENIYLGNVQSESGDSAYSSISSLHLPERFLKTTGRTDSVYNRQNSVFKVGSIEQDNKVGVSLMNEGQPDIGLYV